VRLEVRLRCVDAEDSEEAERQAFTGEGERDADGKRAGKPRCRELQFCLDLFRPTAAAGHLAELLQLQFEQIPWSAAVQEITVHAPLTAPLEVRQGELFDEGAGDCQRQVALLIDRLSSRLGRERVLQPRLVADAQPERACRYVPLAGQPPRKRSRAMPAATPPPQRPLDRPFQIQHPPIPLHILATASDGPPARFQLHLRNMGQRWHTIVRYWGPERIETGWWRGRTVRRDYYRVETDQHQWFWLFRQLHDGRWFLHGVW
jgi:protein ImuB